MAGRRLKPAEHGLIVFAVRATGNVALAQAFAAGYFFFVNDDHEADWLDSLMGGALTTPLPNQFDPPEEQIVFPEWELPQPRSREVRS